MREVFQYAVSSLFSLLCAFLSLYYTITICGHRVELVHRRDFGLLLYNRNNATYVIIWCFSAFVVLS